MATTPSYGRYLTPAEAKSGQYAGKTVTIPGSGIRFLSSAVEPQVTPVPNTPPVPASPADGRVPVPAAVAPAPATTLPPLATPFGRFLTPDEAKSGQYAGKTVTIPGSGIRFKTSAVEPNAGAGANITPSPSTTPPVISSVKLEPPTSPDSQPNVSSSFTSSFDRAFNSLPKNLQDIITSPPPEQKGLVDTYTNLMNSSDIQASQGELNKATDALKTFDLSYQQGIAKNDQQLAPMQIIRGDAAELEKQYLFKRTAMVNDINEKSALLTQKQTNIQTIMELTGKDQANATARYTQEHAAAMQLMGQIQDSMVSDRSFEQTVSQARIDNARADLAVVTNALTTSGSWDKMSPAQQANIHNLELQAGLPVGTTQSFAVSLPKAKLLSTTNGVDAHGNDIISFVYADENGNPGIVKTVKTGAKSKIPGSTNNGPTTDVTKMTVAQVKADYNNSLVGLAGNVQTKAGQTGLTREQAISQMFDYYQGRIPLLTIQKDVYRTYPNVNAAGKNTDKKTAINPAGGRK